VKQVSIDNDGGRNGAMAMAAAAAGVFVVTPTYTVTGLLVV
jgi:hypothetical protein